MKIIEKKEIELNEENIILENSYKNDMELLSKISESKEGKFISFEKSYLNGINKLKF